MRVPPEPFCPLAFWLCTIAVVLLLRHVTFVLEPMSFRIQKSPTGVIARFLQLAERKNDR